MIGITVGFWTLRHFDIRQSNWRRDPSVRVWEVSGLASLVRSHTGLKYGFGAQGSMFRV